MSSKRHRDRLALGAGAVLTVSEASALLPVADCDARAWLRRLGLVRYLEGRQVVCWQDVIDALRRGESPERQGTEKRFPFPRVSLD